MPLLVKDFENHLKIINKLQLIVIPIPHGDFPECQIKVHLYLLNLN